MPQPQPDDIIAMAIFDEVYGVTIIWPENIII